MKTMNFLWTVIFWTLVISVVPASATDGTILIRCSDPSANSRFHLVRIGNNKFEGHLSGHKTPLPCTRSENRTSCSETSWDADGSFEVKVDIQRNRIGGLYANVHRIWRKNIGGMVFGGTNGVGENEISDSLFCN